jgi:ketosteroid isomerase-like protein
MKLLVISRLQISRLQISGLQISLLIFCTMSALAQSTPSGSAEQIKDDLIKIEREVGRANLECDYKFFDRIEGEDFLFTDANGGLNDKKQDMTGEKDCKKHEGKYDVDDAAVRIYGTTAVVTAQITVITNKDGKTVVRKSRFTDVFVWRHARWEMVAGHSSRIAEAKS